MRERPILFNGAMVRAILAGRKVQTRRVAKGVMAVHARTGEALAGIDSAGPRVSCPFACPGDRLWVRESFTDLRGTGIEHRRSIDGPIQRYAYSADTLPGSPGDYARKDYGIKWRPSIHMPREACRLLLEITAVRVERLQAISAQDCIAEGITTRFTVDDGNDDLRIQFRDLWTSTGGDWGSDPWVWVIEFKRVEVAG
jgi:hypothetical protein